MTEDQWEAKYTPEERELFFAYIERKKELDVMLREADQARQTAEEADKRTARGKALVREAFELDREAGYFNHNFVYPTHQAWAQACAKQGNGRTTAMLLDSTKVNSTSRKG